MIIDGAYSIAEQVALQLDEAKKDVVEYDQDRFYVITGREGTGKSTLACQLAYYLDRNFNLDNVVFTAEEFSKIIQNAKKHTAIIFDEAFNGLSSRGSISRQNKEIIRLLMECRQRNLFVFLVLPSFFLLERYPAIFRSEALFIVGRGIKNHKNRRYYKVFGYDQKRLLYIRGKPLMNHNAVKVYLKHAFYSKLPPTIDREEYKDKKLKAFRARPKDDFDGRRSMKGVIQRDIAWFYLNKVLKVRLEDISNFAGSKGHPIGRSTISEAIARVKKG